MADLGSGFIVVGFDGSAESIAALRWALGRAAGMQVPLKVVHCWPATAAPVRRDWRDRRHARDPRRVDTVRAVENELAAARSLIPAPPEVSMVFTAAPVETVLATQTRGAAMLILGASSSAVLRDPSRGPVAGPCLEQIGCTVVVVDAAGRVATAQPRYRTLGLVG